MAGNFAFVELHSELGQILNPRRRFGHNCSDNLFVAQSRACIERVAHMELK